MVRNFAHALGVLIFVSVCMSMFRDDDSVLKLHNLPHPATWTSLATLFVSILLLVVLLLKA